METRSASRRSLGASLLPILMANALCWAIAIIASVTLLHGTGYDARLFPILAGGACVASVAVSIAWRKRKRNDS